MRAVGRGRNARRHGVTSVRSVAVAVTVVVTVTAAVAVMCSEGNKLVSKVPKGVVANDPPQGCAVLGPRPFSLFEACNPIHR